MSTTDLGLTTRRTGDSFALFTTFSLMSWWKAYRRKLFVVRATV